MGWVIALGVLLIIAFTRVRLKLQHEEDGFAASVRVGVIRIKLFPRVKKMRIKPQKDKKPEKEPKKTEVRQRRVHRINITWNAVRDIMAIAKKTFKRVLRLFRFELIDLRLTSGGRDAAKTAIRYGTFNTIVHTAYPFLKNNLRIKKEIISISLDYSLPNSAFYGRIWMSVSIGRMVIFGIVSAGALIGFYFKHKNKNKREALENGQQQQQAQAG